MLPAALCSRRPLRVREAYKGKGERFSAGSSFSISRFSRDTGKGGAIIDSRTRADRTRKRMRVVFIVLAVASWRSCAAFPQGGGSESAEPLEQPFAVDGFVFDGPASGAREPGNGARSSLPATTTTTPTTPTSSSSTAASTEDDPRFTECVKACPVTIEYNPVCGTDLVDYQNPGRLSCAALCGKDVTVRNYGRCTTTKIRGR